jgi:hypothetical protein
MFKGLYTMTKWYSVLECKDGSTYENLIQYNMLINIIKARHGKTTGNINSLMKN